MRTVAAVILASTLAVQQDAVVTMRLAPFASPGVTIGPLSSVVIALEVRHPSPTRAGEEKIGVVINVLTDTGRAVTDVHHKVDLELVAGGAPIVYEIVSSVDLKPGRYVFKAAVGGSRGRLGGTTAEVTVPDFTKSGLVLSGAVLAASAGSFAAASPSLRGFLPIVPTVTRELTPRHRATAFVRVYRQGGDINDPISITATVTDDSRNVVFTDRRGVTLRWYPQRRFAGDYSVELPLATLAAGTYHLKIDAAAGGRHASPAVLTFVVGQ